MILDKIGGVAMIKNNKTKFVVGDEVTIISSGSHGKIKDIVSYFGEDQNLYSVDVMGIEKMCIESNLEMYRKKNNILDFDMDEFTLSLQIEDKINDIINELDLKKTKEDKDQLLNASKLQMYLCLTQEYQNDIKCLGNDLLKYHLYNGLINGVNDPIINSCVFSEVLRRVGMDVKNVILKLQDSSFYMANLVLIGNYYYYFDVTLEKEIFKDNGSDDDNFILCCAALGKNSYNQFFTPLSLVDFKDKLAPTELPKNISVEDIDIDLLNKLLSMGS